MEAGVERSSSDLDFVHVFNDALHMFAQQSFFFFFLHPVRSLHFVQQQLLTLE